MDRLKPERALDTGGVLVGRDADFSWFRFVIPAGKVMRDDLPTGQHDFIPLNPSDRFPTTQQDIYLVFRLVSDSYDAVPLASQCFLETTEATGHSGTIAQDHVLMAMSDQSGYFTLGRPEQGGRRALPAVASLPVNAHLPIRKRTKCASASFSRTSSSS